MPTLSDAALARSGAAEKHCALDAGDVDQVKPKSFVETLCTFVESSNSEMHCRRARSSRRVEKNLHKTPTPTDPLVWRQDIYVQVGWVPSELWP